MVRGLSAAKQRRLTYLRSKRKNVMFTTKQAKKLKQIANAEEIKFFDTDITTAGTSSGVISSSSLNLMQEGDTDQSRDGNECLLSRIDIRGNLELPEESDQASVGLLTPSLCRMIVYYDKQCNGAAAAVTDILAGATFDSFYNLDNRKRFRMLYDKVHSFNVLPTSDGGTANQYDSAVQYRNIRWGMKLNKKIVFDATTGAITDLTSGNIGVLLITKGADVNVDLKARIRFIG